MCIGMSLGINIYPNISLGDMEAVFDAENELKIELDNKSDAQPSHSDIDTNKIIEDFSIDSGRLGDTDIDFEGLDEGKVDCGIEGEGADEGDLAEGDLDEGDLDDDLSDIVFKDDEGIEDDEDDGFDGIDDTDFGDIIDDSDICEEDLTDIEDTDDDDFDGIDDTDFGDIIDDESQEINDTEQEDSGTHKVTDVQSVTDYEGSTSNTLERIKILQEEARLAELEAELTRKKIEAEHLRIEQENRLKELQRSHNKISVESNESHVKNDTAKIRQEKIQKLLDEKKRRENIKNSISNSTENKAEKYSLMDIDALYNEVRKFLKVHNVEHRIISTKILEDEFGKDNIRKLIIKSYLISIGKGVTVGK